MPELPEVQTIKNQLQREIVGKQIKAVEVFLPKIIKAPLADFKKRIIGASITKVGRRAKILIICLSNGWSLLIHLKLTGQLIYQGTKGKYTHIIYIFTDGSGLLYNDMMQFGYVKLVKTENLAEFFQKEKFGLEPLEKDFTLNVFRTLLAKKPKTRIKQFLMDQKNIAGIGNIYSDEILFAAGIHPLRHNQTLKPEEVKRIYRAIRNILNRAIKYRGTTVRDYRDIYNQEGYFLSRIKVYGQEGKKCIKCKGIIKRSKINGRSAHFCPNCQKLN